jgi:predicted metal-dependent enzyme (double-stranded beta helix superfamily)
MPASTTSTRSVVLDGDLDPSRFAHLTPAATQAAPTLAQLVHRARTVAARSAEWRHLVRFDAGQRWRLRLDAEDGYEVWLMSWLPGQRTGMHDHGESAAVIAVADGELTEHSVAPGRDTQITTIGVDQVRIWGARHVREIVNAGSVPAVSVHVYSPPLAAG